MKFRNALSSHRSLGLVVVCGLAAISAMPGGNANSYQQQNLVSDAYYEAPHHDRNLVNPWGLALNPLGVWWIANEDTGTSTVYDGNGTPVPIVVTVPVPPNDFGGAPAGVVYNPTNSFEVTDGTSSEPAVYLFAGLDGVISGWNPDVPPPSPSDHAIVVVDHMASDAVYIGIAIATTGSGDRLYAADFHNGRIDVFDGQFQAVNLPGAFVDPAVPSDYGPFNVMNLGGELFVAYAKRDPNGDDEVTGSGLGFVSVFDTNGNLLRSLVHHSKLNAPWGMAIAPANFGAFSNMLLVANFGDGRINAFHPQTGAWMGFMKRGSGSPIHVDGMWGLAFGDGSPTNPSDVLFFTAGPADEAHGVFGRISVQ